MNRKTGRYHHGDLHNALVSAAIFEINQKGEEHLSLRGIAGAIGVNPSATYKHFKSKKDLVHAACSLGFSQLSEKMESAIEHGSADPEARFIDTGKAYVNFAIQNPNLYHCMFANVAGGNEAISQAPPGKRSAYQILLDGLEALEKERPFDENKAPKVRMIAWAGMHGLAELAIAGYVESDDASIGALIEQHAKATIAYAR